MDGIKKSHLSRNANLESSKMVESLREIQRRVGEKVDENSNQVDIEICQGQQAVAVENEDCVAENESDSSSILNVNSNEIQSSTQHPIECCQVIQPIVDKIETTLNSLSSKQQSSSDPTAVHDTNPGKSITLTLESQQFRSILPEFKTTKLSNGQIHVELKLNLE